jgi:hypothetical protein
MQVPCLWVGANAATFHPLPQVQIAWNRLRDVLGSFLIGLDYTFIQEKF